MIRGLALAVLISVAGPALAQTATPPIQEETPHFQPIRPVAPEPVAPPAAAPAAPAEPVAAPEPAPEAQPAAQDPVPAAMKAIETKVPFQIPNWALGIVVLSVAFLAGSFLAGVVGAMVFKALRRSELKARRRAVATTLATELETRRLAFEAVPMPPNAEAGVSFVSSVISLAGIEAGYRSAQGELFLLPPQTAANLSVHYAAVQRVADFVKGQSLAAAVRMMQANRLGGHPCPDAGAMRDAHVEMAAAFRGIDKVIAGLKTLAK
ncbi:conserved exported hypothetical protein [Magnetospirillum sp. LM-5]|uniref:hypothetical protein n=1 Tax=Magnetospirillum sp. LM-5 TaxID=2681466 RepID=UPI00138644F3|nr:hypothetical protein [Magnetospirillum sp. LM-5]CAA7621237.1 conserved exported hypothetical protein [Magnetospirillum sp. LM-5]